MDHRRGAGRRGRLALLAGQHTIAGVIIGWCLAQAAPNSMQASLTAAVPDQVPVPQRGVVSGWIGIPQTVGVLLAVVLVTYVVTGNAGYLPLGAVVLACALPFAASVPDAPLARTGHRGAAGQPARRVPRPVPRRRRDHHRGLGLRLEHPVSPVNCRVRPPRPGSVRPGW